MLVLASQSPRRRELLSLAGYNYAVEAAGVDETLPRGIAPGDAVRMLSQQKAAAVAARRPGDVVLAADTLVACEGEILGIPKDTATAREMLTLLSGRTHNVYTGCTIVSAEQTQSFVSETDVVFYTLTPQEIDDYIATGDPFDKAGGYGIQSKGCSLVREIHGDYYTVVGLTIARVIRELRVFRVFPAQERD